MIVLSFGQDMKVRVELTPAEAAALRDHLDAVLPPRTAPPPVNTDPTNPAFAARAVTAAREKGNL